MCRRNSGSAVWFLLSCDEYASVCCILEKRVELGTKDSEEGMCKSGGRGVFGVGRKAFVGTLNFCLPEAKGRRANEDSLYVLLLFLSVRFTRNLYV